jgi:hypothetical protein
MYKKKSHGGSNLNSLNSSSFEEKNSFFYDNAIDIIESKDCYNKYSFLDLLGNFTGKNKPKKQKKIKKIKNDLLPVNNKFYSSSTTFNSPSNTQKNFFSKSQKTSPHKFLMTNIKIKNPPGVKNLKNINTEKTYFHSQINFQNKDKESTSNLTSRMPTINLNSNNISISQTSQQGNIIFSHTSKLNLEKHYESLKKIKLINQTLSNFTRDFDKNRDDSSNNNINNDSKFNNKSSSEKNNFSHRKNNSHGLNLVKNQPGQNKSPLRFSQGLFGEPNLNAKLKKLKHEAEKPVKKIKIKYDFLKGLNLKEKKPNFKEIGKMKILKIPQKFKEKDSEIKVHQKSNSLHLEQDMMKNFYKIKNSKVMKKEDYWDKLSEPYKTNYFSSDEKERCESGNNYNNINNNYTGNNNFHGTPGSTFLNLNSCTINQNSHRNFLLQNLENIKNFEKAHLKIKNKILKVRKKYQNSSLYVNPKHIVSLPQKEEEEN